MSGFVEFPFAPEVPVQTPQLPWYLFSESEDASEAEYQDWPEADCPAISLDSDEEPNEVSVHGTEHKAMLAKVQTVQIPWVEMRPVADASPPTPEDELVDVPLKPEANSAPKKRDLTDCESTAMKFKGYTGDV